MVQCCLLTQFLSNWSQCVVVDGCHSKLVNVVLRVPQGSVLGLQLFLLYTAELFSIVENKLYGYADDSTLVAVVSSPGERVAVSESMNCDLNRVGGWCNLWGMKLNASKTKNSLQVTLSSFSVKGTVLAGNMFFCYMVFFNCAWKKYCTE